MKIITLEKKTEEEVRHTMNAAFSDYAVPLFFTSKDFGNMLHRLHIDLKDCLGVEDNGQLVALILKGKQQINGQTCYYNAGTGVIPSFRGNGLTVKMYHRFICDAQKGKAILEVLTDNMPAIKSYKKVGYTQKRVFNCFKGTVANIQLPETILVKEDTSLDFDQLEQARAFAPCWQKSTIYLKRDKVSKNISFFDKNDTKIGIAIYKIDGGINYFFIHKNYRRQGYGKLLLSEIQKRVDSDIRYINVDTTYKPLNNLLHAAGLTIHTTQFEMELAISN